jgi:hypothetical protein
MIGALLSLFFVFHYFSSAAAIISFWPGLLRPNVPRTAEVAALPT